MGDSSDNDPGDSGVGEKTATKIIAQFGSIENAHEHLEEIKPNKGQRIDERTLRSGCFKQNSGNHQYRKPLEYSYEEARLGNLYTQQAYELCRKLEFKNLLGRFDAEAVPENTIEQNFFVCSELSGVEALFEKAARNSMAGIALIADKNNVYGLRNWRWKKKKYIIFLQKGFCQENIFVKS